MTLQQGIRESHGEADRLLADLELATAQARRAGELDALHREHDPELAFARLAIDRIEREVRAHGIARELVERLDEFRR